MTVSNRRSTTKRSTTERPGAGAAGRTGSRWSSRLGVVALGTLLVPALVTVVLPGATTPSGGPLDVTALALTARSSLLEAADGYRALEQTAAHRPAIPRKSGEYRDTEPSTSIRPPRTINTFAADAL